MERAFQLGGDDYVSKREELRRLEESMGLTPAEWMQRKSDTEELVARVKARLDQVETEQEIDDALRVNLIKQQVQVKSEGQWIEVNLTATEFSLLEALIKSAGRPVGKVQLMDLANIDGEGSLQNHIWRLRRKIEPFPENPRYILIYHGIGYRFRSK
jgi:DNA-binding response OmpR family regulator